MHRFLPALACLHLASALPGWTEAGRGPARRERPDALGSGAAATIAASAEAPLADSAPGRPERPASPQDLVSLLDQEGRPFSFAGLGKRTVLVNFIFTSCPVKCPTQTRDLVALQRALPPPLQARVRFVSVTVDPERDSAAVLKRYATALGADLASWSFVTGTQSELDWLYRFFSVGVAALEGGQYDHQMGAYLLDARGRVMQRYTGDIDKPRLLREIGAIDALAR